MNSEISTESDRLQPWQLFTLAGLAGAMAVVFASQSVTKPQAVLLSVIVIAAAYVGLAVWRTFAPLMGRVDISAPEILGGRTRAALEREKTLVLRSIKDLEFDRAMGKISEQDFTDMSARLRARAAGLMRQLDRGGNYRDEIERQLARRMPPVGRALSGPPGGPEGSAPPKSAAARHCIGCNTINDRDARFCKSCGKKLEAA